MLIESFFKNWLRMSLLIGDYDLQPPLITLSADQSDSEANRPGFIQQWECHLIKITGAIVSCEVV